MAGTEQKRVMCSLQGVRAVAFLGIFLNHSFSGTANLGAAGVSVFVMLSGFLMACSYLQKKELPERLGFAGSLRLARKKIKRLYPLHILILAVFLFLQLRSARQGGEGLAMPFGCFGLDVLLMQAWVPRSSYYFSLNAVSWYLSSALFTYFFFPVLLRVLKRGPSTRRLVGWLIGLFSAVGCISLFAFLFGDAVDSAWFSQHWITYVFPVSRAVDFSIGAFAGALFLRLTEKSKERDASRQTRPKGAFFYTGIELAAIVLMAAAIAVFYQTPSALRYTAIFVLPSFFLIPILALERGWIARFLSLKPFQIIGDLSGYGFLIHLLAISLTTIVFGKFFPAAPNVLVVFFALIATLIASELYRRIFFIFQNRQP